MEIIFWIVIIYIIYRIIKKRQAQGGNRGFGELSNVLDGLTNPLGDSDNRKRVLSIIAASRVYSVSQISQLSGISEAEVVSIIQWLISHANGDWRRNVQVSHLGDLDPLRGAHLDLDRMEIILAGNVSVEPMKPPWVCPYCRGKNHGSDLVCSGCKARRQE